MTNPRVALYLRVSTHDQSFASQEKALRDYCTRRGWGDLTVYREKQSGAKESRPVLGRLMEAARAGAVDVIVVFKLDRFGRSVPHMLHLLQELKTRKIGFVCSSQAIDTTEENGAIGELIITLLIAVAGFERTLAQERILAGLAAARASGKRIGRPRENDAKIARVLALRRHNARLGASAIARRVGLSTSYVSRLLRGKRAATEKGKA